MSLDEHQPGTRLSDCIAEAIAAAGLIHKPDFLAAGLVRRWRAVDVDYQAALDALAADTTDPEERRRRMDRLEVERVDAYVAAARSALAPLRRSFDAGRAVDRVLAELRTELEGGRLRSR